jgi:4'-phosphopantetheinyl transferase
VRSVLTAASTESAVEDWHPPPTHRFVAHNEVQVWRARLSSEGRALASCFQTLSPDEREKADRFRFPRDRVRYIVARATLRNILSRYLDTPPGRIRFTYGSHGKPALDDGIAGPRLRFNVSHAEDIALYAVARARAVGIDIEYVRDGHASMDIAERFFSPAEVAALKGLPQHQQSEAFFNCWTRKEAYLKALGEGLSYPLDHFTVSVTPGESAAVLTVPDSERSWSLSALRLPRGYVGALVVEGDRPIIRRWAMDLVGGLEPSVQV